MEVILKKDVPNLGRMGEVVRVKNGYARNYLIPRSFAIAASSGQKRMLEHQRRTIEALKKKVQKESEEKSGSFKELTIKIKKRFNESGKMFGSVSSSELLKALEAKGHAFDKRDIEVPAIKDAGTHAVKIRLPGDVYTEFQLEIEAITVKEKKTKKKAKDTENESEEKADNKEASAAEEQAAPEASAESATEQKEETEEAKEAE